MKVKRETGINLYIPIDISGIYSVNPFMTEFVRSLERNGLDVQHGLFWLTDTSSTWKIVNFQWPEQIFGWREPSDSQLRWLEKRLIEISETSKIISTIHNIAPHYQNTERFSKLYKLIYKHSDAFVHLGQASEGILSDRFPQECANKIHRVIPHGNYNAFGKSLPRDIARSKLELPADGQLVLVVGQLRSKEEYNLVADSLPLWNDLSSGLLLAATLTFIPNLHIRNFPRYLWFRIWMWHQMRRFRKKGNVFIKQGPIPHEQMNALVCAADVILIPRLKVLNSGNVPLGFTYGKVVVGPDVGVVGQILKTTGNPIFELNGGVKGVAQAVKLGLKLAEAGHGISNERIAQIDWDWDVIAMQYRTLYEELLGLR